MGKGGRCVRLTTSPPACAFVTKSGNLNFLEPSGPVQACNATAFSMSESCKSAYIITENRKRIFVKPDTAVLFKV